MTSKVHTNRTVSSRAGFRARVMNHAPFIPAVPSRGANRERTRRVLRDLRWLAVVVSMVGLLGCVETGPSEYRVVGLIRFDDVYWPLPEIPERATANVPSEITTWTGGSSCYRRGDTEVVVNGRSAVVTPYDIYEDHDLGCYTNLTFFEHKATVLFKEPGTAEIELVYTDGRAGRPDENDKGDGRKVYTVEVEGYGRKVNTVEAAPAGSSAPGSSTGRSVVTMAKTPPPSRAGTERVIIQISPPPSSK